MVNSLFKDHALIYIYMYTQSSEYMKPLYNVIIILLNKMHLLNNHFCNEL